MPWVTHEVVNQVPPLQDYNLFDTDEVLRETLAKTGADWHAEALRRYGDALGAARTLRLAERANRNAPVLRTHDARGERIDQVEFDPAWHALMAMLYAEGVHCMAWAEPRPGAQAARAAAFYLHGQIEAGTLCPTTMSYAAIPLLTREPALFSALAAKLFSRRYDDRDLPLAAKHSMVIGMGMTEKQGGSDLRGNTTAAWPLGAGGRGGEYALVGHKWFFSAPQADAHLVLARAKEGLSCFWLPRFRPDGTRNSVRIQRLKEKLGNRSNASAEVEFCDAYAVLIGEPGRGIATILEMAAQTRLDCVLGSAALMRQALVQAIHHARHRAAFGRPLIAQPLMRAVLVDLALESEAATRLALRLATACEKARDDVLERALWRIVTPAAKFWICKRAVAFVAECMEVLGGNGYVEEAPLARLFREAPVNSIWEGSGNVVCLDVLRALAREPEGVATLRDMMAPHGVRMPAVVDDLSASLGATPGETLDESQARRFAQQLVLAIQAALVVEGAPDFIAEAFIASRLAGMAGVFGAGAARLSEAQIDRVLTRAWPDGA